ncbi:MAG: M48 family metalloprotease [Myxococcota bacterium]
MTRPLIGLLVLTSLGACRPRASAPPTSPPPSSSAAALGASMAKAQECRRLAARPVTPEEEQRFGAELARLLRLRASDRTNADGGVSPEPPWATLTDRERAEVEQDLTSLGQRLASSSARPSLPWSFTVVETERSLFFSAPGGFVSISTGLLARVENEAQLALVLSLAITGAASGRDLKELRRMRETACLAEQLQADLPAEMKSFSEPRLTPEQTQATSLHMLSGLVAASAMDFTEDEVTTAVHAVAGAGLQPVDGARLLDGLPREGDGWRIDGPGLAALVRKHAEPPRGKKLSAPRSKAADLISRKKAP